jgi:hypothetical protein
MRPRFRLRTLLIALALLSPLLAWLAFAARSWYADFQNHQAALARRCWREAHDLRSRAGNLREQLRTGQPLNDRGKPANAKQIEEFQQRADECFRKAHWHEFLSGRSLPNRET